MLSIGGAWDGLARLRSPVEGAVDSVSGFEPQEEPMLLLDAIHEAARRSEEYPSQVWAVWHRRDDSPQDPYRYRASWYSGASFVHEEGVVLEFRRGECLDRIAP